MATISDIKQTVHDELVTALANHLSVPETDIETNAQVRPANRYEDGGFPAYTTEAFESVVDYGLGSAVYVDEVTRLQDGTIDSITVRREKNCRFDIGAHATADDQMDVDQLYTQLETHFTPLIEDVGLVQDVLHPDAEKVRLYGTSDVGQPSDGVRGDRFRMDVQYKRYIELRDIPTMETIDATITVMHDGEELTVHSNQTT